MLITIYPNTFHASTFDAIVAARTDSSIHYGYDINVRHVFTSRTYSDLAAPTRLFMLF